jgi:prolyl oligopeptidase
VPQLIPPPPFSRVIEETDFLHGVRVIDPYRWLEDAGSQPTQAWVEEQTLYARCYLDAVPGRERIRRRIREFLAIETYDSLEVVGNRYFFRKRLPEQEQPCLYMREGADGQDQLLLDPAEHGTSKYSAVKLLRVSPLGNLLLCELKEGGEQSGVFAILDIERRETLSDVLPRGYLRAFAFAHDESSFYYVHEALAAKHPATQSVYQHTLGTPFSRDHAVFCPGNADRLSVLSGYDRLGFLVYRSADKILKDFYIQTFESPDSPELILKDADYTFAPYFLNDQILALTDCAAPNFRVVRVLPRKNREPEFVDIIPATDSRIQGWLVSRNRILVSTIRQTKSRVDIFDFFGKKTGEISSEEDETVRLIGGSPHSDEALIEVESFTEPIRILRCSAESGARALWAKKNIPFEAASYSRSRNWYASKDGTKIPISLVGRRDVLESGPHPTVLTSYGGYGVSMTPQFSVLVAFLIEYGCVFALPNIRGGSEFGAEWHKAAKRRNRQIAYDDFLCAAEWLIHTGVTTPAQLAIFGGSNSGLLVGVAMTQRPDLFRAALCMVPLLDMLRYHLFDNARSWSHEFGTADDPEDFQALAHYSPYHHVELGVAYPATLIVSGERDTKCNPAHARKMTARLQTASSSGHPVLLDYNKFRGHSPVLPLNERIEGLTDRLAFLSDQLELSV